MGRGFWLSSLAVAVLAVGLPCLGTFVRRQRLPQCALDGVAIDPVYAVEIIDGQGKSQRFCCIRCAQYWLAKEPLVTGAVHVTDEVSARPLDAADAYFVRSNVITNPVTGNRIHSFAGRGDAESHAKQFRGRILDDGERPLQRAP